MSSERLRKVPLRHSARFLSGIVSVTIIVGILDILTGPVISLSLFYLLPVGAAAWRISRRVGFLIATLAVLIWLGCDLVTDRGYSHIAMLWWNAAMRLSVFSVVVLLISAIRWQTDLLDWRVKARTRSLQREIRERKRIEREVFDLLQQQKQEIAHELHDDLAQFLTGVSIKTKLLEEELRSTSFSQAESAARIVQLLNEAVGRTRQIARGLSPMEMDAGELIPALRRLASEIEDSYRVDCTLESNITSPRLALDSEVHVFRIVQQAIDNAIRHGSPRSIQVNLESNDSHLKLSIEDDGCGFLKNQISKEGIGLRIMRFRADLIGGTLNVRSAPGEGVRIECIVPTSTSQQGKPDHQLPT